MHTTRQSGIGMTSARTRARMIERIRTQGIHDEFVLAALATIPRHIFVDDAIAHRAYEDTALPIGHGQTISQPYIVARMTELMRAGRSLNKVLEVGTGCGYQTAVLAQVAEEVYTVERIGALLARARRTLIGLKIKNVRLQHADGQAALPEDLWFDGIVVTAAANHVPPSLTSRLAEGGRMVIPLNKHADQQQLVVLEKKAQGLIETRYDAVRFVPLLSGVA